LKTHVQAIAANSGWDKRTFERRRRQIPESGMQTSFVVHALDESLDRRARLYQAICVSGYQDYQLLFSRILWVSLERGSDLFNTHQPFLRVR
jgi:hypothetical protein